MRLTRATIAALAVLTLGACSGDPVSIATDSYRGLPGDPPPDMDRVRDQEFSAAWVDKGSTFAVTTWGSSSCPPIPVKVHGTDHHVDVEFEDSPHNVCTMDISPTTHVLELPQGTSDHRVEVTLSGLSEPVQAVLP